MSPGDRPIAIENPFFKLLLGIVTSAFFVTLATMVTLAFWGRDPLTEAQKALMEFCRYACSTTLGAVVGRGAGPDAIAKVTQQFEADQSRPKKK